MLSVIPSDTLTTISSTETGGLGGKGPSGSVAVLRLCLRWGVGVAVGETTAAAPWFCVLTFAEKCLFKEIKLIGYKK